MTGDDLIAPGARLPDRRDNTIDIKDQHSPIVGCVPHPCSVAGTRLAGPTTMTMCIPSRPPSVPGVDPARPPTRPRLRRNTGHRRGRHRTRWAQPNPPRASVSRWPPGGQLPSVLARRKGSSISAGSGRVPWAAPTIAETRSPGTVVDMTSPRRPVPARAPAPEAGHEFLSPSPRWLAIDVVQHLDDERHWVLGVETRAGGQMLPGTKMLGPTDTLHLHVFEFDRARSRHHIVNGLSDKEGWGSVEVDATVRSLAHDLLAEFVTAHRGKD